MSIGRGEKGSCVNKNCGMARSRCSPVLLHVGIAIYRVVGKRAAGVQRQLASQGGGGGVGSNVEVTAPYGCSLLYRADFFFVKFTEKA